MNTTDEEFAALLATLDPVSRALAVEVDLGEEAKHFVASPIGRYMIGCAQQEIVEAKELLATTSPWRRRRIQELQNRVWRAESFLSWLRDLIVSGHRAGQALDTGE